MDKSGFDAMGHPIPSDRKQAALDFVKEVGITSNEDAMLLVGSVADKLERDKPYDAQRIALESLDLTGSYRLIATLLTSPQVSP